MTDDLKDRLDATTLTVTTVIGDPDMLGFPYYRQECRICDWIGEPLAGFPWRNAEKQCPKCQPKLECVGD